MLGSIVQHYCSSKLTFYLVKITLCFETLSFFHTQVNLITKSVTSYANNMQDDVTHTSSTTCIIIIQVTDLKKKMFQILSRI